MTLFQSLILGIVQGLTEFLPISSSAHLVLVPAFFNWEIAQSEMFVFSVLVQWGTLIAVLLYFWTDLLPIGLAMLASLQKRKIETQEARLGWLIILGTVPALAIGWMVRNVIQSAFISPIITAYLLFATGVFLVLAEWMGSRKRHLNEIDSNDALLIGLFQAFSLLPGISRSGATIAGGMTRNLTRRAAARFSFLLAVPVMIAAGVVALTELEALPSIDEFFPVLFVGFAISAIIGYFSIRWFIQYLSSRSLYPFAIYCSLLAFLSILTFNG